MSTRPVPSVRGTLASDPLARLLAVALGPLPTGTLELTSPDGVVSEVVLVRGALAKIRVPRPTLFLGSVAYELGHLSAEQLNASLLEIARTKRLHGELLVGTRLLTQEQLTHCLVEQMRRKLHALFALPPETAVAFFPSHDALSGFGGDDWPRCDIRPSIWYGVREHPPAPHVARVMSAAAGARLRLADASDPRAWGLDGDELALAEALRVRPLLLEEIAALGPLDKRRKTLLVYCLSIAGCLERHAAHEARRESGTRAAAAPPSQPAPSSRPIRHASGVMAKAVPPGGPPPDPEAAANLAVRAYAAVQAGKLGLASALCDEAHEADPAEVDHAALRIWIGALREGGQTEEATLQAIGALNQLIVMHDESVHAHFFRGQLLKRVGRMSDAASDFEAVLELDPSRRDAHAELRLYDARRMRRR
jgi:hypothetical protein